MDGWIARGTSLGSKEPLRNAYFLKVQLHIRVSQMKTFSSFFFFFFGIVFFFFFTDKYHESAKFFHIIPISRKDYFSCMCSH